MFEETGEEKGGGKEGVEGIREKGWCCGVRMGIAEWITLLLSEILDITLYGALCKGPRRGSRQAGRQAVIVITRSSLVCYCLFGLENGGGSEFCDGTFYDQCTAVMYIHA